MFRRKTLDLHLESKKGPTECTDLLLYNLGGSHWPGRNGNMSARHIADQESAARISN